MSKFTRTRVYIGNLLPNTQKRDIHRIFDEFGKIVNVDMIPRRNSTWVAKGPWYAFVEFEDHRDARDAVLCLNGCRYTGLNMRDLGPLRVEFPRGSKSEEHDREREERDKSRTRSPYRTRRSLFKAVVTGFPFTTSWQDLKDHFRKAKPFFAEIKDGVGFVEFTSHSRMKYAIKYYDNTEICNHMNHSGYITVKKDPDMAKENESDSSSDSSQSRSPSRRRSRSHSRRYRTRSPTPKDRHRTSTKNNLSYESGNRSRSRSPSYRDRRYSETLKYESNGRSDLAASKYEFQSNTVVNLAIIDYP